MSRSLLPSLADTLKVEVRPDALSMAKVQLEVADGRAEMTRLISSYLCGSSTSLARRFVVCDVSVTRHFIAVNHPYHISHCIRVKDRGASERMVVKYEK